MLVGDGKKTIDRFEIEETFKQLQLAVDLSNLKRLAEIRNDIEHMHPQHAPALIRALKTAHGLKPSFEAKWTKVSPAKSAFYLSLIDLFLADDRLGFCGLVVPEMEAAE